ncbi:SPFH domain-containing protein [Mycolicibacterium sp.]|uniref:SPFH domain-containing protein n=1 Tax=Mycolicibacterium sp. TaxID=2320850 RepID=UPI003D0B4F91
MPDRTVAALAILALAASMSACSYANMGPGEQAVVQDGYWMIPTDPKLTGCIQPERSQNEITNHVYRYPARQISWDATGDPGSERGPYVVVSSAKAPADMNVPVVVTFDLTTDCEKLKQFHRDFGTKYSGWLNEDGSVSEGWTELLNYVVGQPLQDTLNAVAQKYTWQQIWNDEAARTEFRNALLNTLPNASKARTDNTEFFSNFQVTVLKPTPVNPELKAAIEREQAAVQDAQATQAQGVAEANAKRAKAEADIAAAEAETRVAEQEALKLRAKLSGYPSVEDYLRALCIEQGCNPYQPTYVVPQGG